MGFSLLFELFPFLAFIHHILNSSSDPVGNNGGKEKHDPKSYQKDDDKSYKSKVLIKLEQHDTDDLGQR